ncbi:MAG: MarR family transcriptional regulator [Mollicutes bacterium]|nr:MarR family transcriptional regulator [Mollicutes bacterium]
MEEYSVFYKIKELEKILLKNLAKPIEDKKKNSKQIHRPTPTQMRIVDYLLNYIDKEYIYQKDIEEALNLSKATVSDVLNRMEKNGLIERNTNPNDTRSKMIVLSKDTKELFENNKKRLQELEKKAKKDITQEELEIFSNILNKMIKNFEKEEEQ